MDLLLIFIFGLVIGSFLNVCIYRLPLGQSIAYPPSHCGKCETDLKPFDLIPVITFLLLGGKCRYCSQKISCRYPFVELLTGILFVIIYLYIGFNLTLLPYLFFITLLIVISFIDIDHYRIPDKLIVFGIIIGMIFHILTPFVTYIDALIGFFIGSGILFLLAVLSKGGMGGGDIKLAALIGLFLGWKLTLLTLFLSSLLASLIGVSLILLGKKDRKDPIPFGPFLALGALIALLYGNVLLEFYFRNFIN